MGEETRFLTQEDADLYEGHEKNILNSSEKVDNSKSFYKKFNSLLSDEIEFRSKKYILNTIARELISTEEKLFSFLYTARHDIYIDYLCESLGYLNPFEAIQLRKKEPFPEESRVPFWETREYEDFKKMSGGAFAFEFWKFLEENKAKKPRDCLALELRRLFRKFFPP